MRSDYLDSASLYVKHVLPGLIESLRKTAVALESSAKRAERDVMQIPAKEISERQRVALRREATQVRDLSRDLAVNIRSIADALSRDHVLISQKIDTARQMVDSLPLYHAQPDGRREQERFTDSLRPVLLSLQRLIDESAGRVKSCTLSAGKMLETVAAVSNKRSSKWEAADKKFINDASEKALRRYAEDAADELIRVSGSKVTRDRWLQSLYAPTPDDILNLVVLCGWPADGRRAEWARANWESINTDPRTRERLRILTQPEDGYTQDQEGFESGTEKGREIEQFGKDMQSRSVGKVKSAEWASALVSPDPQLMRTLISKTGWREGSIGERYAMSEWSKRHQPPSHP